MKSRSKHSGRIEVTPALKTLDSIRFTVRSVWMSACRHDGIDPSESFVEFSNDNPFVPYYEKALTTYNKTMAEYQAGGYVGLTIDSLGR